MDVQQLRWTEVIGWESATDEAPLDGAQVVLLFGAPETLESTDALATLRERFPAAEIVGCTTAGDIAGTEVREQGAVATALRLEETAVRVAAADLPDAQHSREAGLHLAEALRADDLVHVLTFAEGLAINGSEFAAGLRDALPPTVAVTGGLAGDGDRFGRTLVCHGGGLHERSAVAVGFYGSRLRVGFGSMGGWDSFGPERLVTRAEGNVLYELDGESALQLYKRYLGPHAAELPASGLRFPLSLRTDTGDERVVRTILGVDESEGSLTFAGAVPTGSSVRLMKANIDRLVDGAHGAASASRERVGGQPPEVALLISCVGRRLVLRQRVEEELDSVRDVLGARAVLCGFYSYGEIAPFAASARCELHNQTMTITTLSERT